jgi:HAMP domain-containing protein
VKLTRVDLTPIRAFVNKDAKLPVLGDDPRDPTRRRIFSAAPIGGGQRYLYVMLASERPAGLAGLLAHSDVVPRAAAVAALSVLVALVAGLAIFALMTRRLERLAAAMSEFQRSDFSRRPQLPAANDPGGDEIDGSRSRSRRWARDSRRSCTSSSRTTSCDASSWPMSRTI